MGAYHNVIEVCFARLLLICSLLHRSSCLKIISSLKTSWQPSHWPHYVCNSVPLLAPQKLLRKLDTCDPKNIIVWRKKLYFWTKSSGKHLWSSIYPTWYLQWSFDTCIESDQTKIFMSKTFWPRCRLIWTASWRFCMNSFGQRWQRNSWKVHRNILYYSIFSILKVQTS